MLLSFLIQVLLLSHSLLFHHSLLIKLLSCHLIAWVRFLFFFFLIFLFSCAFVIKQIIVILWFFRIFNRFMDNSIITRVLIELILSLIIKFSISIFWVWPPSIFFIIVLVFLLFRLPTSLFLSSYFLIFIIQNPFISFCNFWFEIHDKWFSFTFWLVFIQLTKQTHWSFICLNYTSIRLWYKILLFFKSNMSLNGHNSECLFAFIIYH